MYIWNLTENQLETLIEDDLNTLEAIPFAYHDVSISQSVNFSQGPHITYDFEITNPVLFKQQLRRVFDNNITQAINFIQTVAGNPTADPQDSKIKLQQTLGVVVHYNRSKTQRTKVKSFGRGYRQRFQEEGTNSPVALRLIPTVESGSIPLESMTLIQLDFLVDLEAVT